MQAFKVIKISKDEYKDILAIESSFRILRRF